MTPPIPAIPAIPRLCVLVSGGGTTLQNFIDRIADGRFHATIAGVVSSKAEAYGVERAKKAGLPVAVVPRKPTETFSDRVFAAVREFRPDLVCLAGWLHLIQIPADFKRRVLNIHPSLLPAFGGKGMYGHHVHEAVLASGVKESGCTVHYADDEYDTGPIITQRRVPVLPGDTPDTLAARVFEAECEAYVEGVRRVVRG
ncbi:MAG: phosphoribosylglycinamide formyltransferase [Gemmataceae bacterium]